ncbi:hypothetical protein EI555_002903, partial [Monodon monoceros]
MAGLTCWIKVSYAVVGAKNKDSPVGMEKLTDNEAPGESAEESHTTGPSRKKKPITQKKKWLKQKGSRNKSVCHIMICQSSFSIQTARLKPPHIPKQYFHEIPELKAKPPQRLQAGVAIGRLCERWDGKCVICDSYVCPCTLVHMCDECNYGSYQGRCVIRGGPRVSDAYFCKKCTIQEKDRDGCPKIVSFGSSKTDLLYERKKQGLKKRLERRTRPRVLAPRTTGGGGRAAGELAPAAPPPGSAAGSPPPRGALAGRLRARPRRLGSRAGKGRIRRLGRAPASLLVYGKVSRQAPGLHVAEQGRLSHLTGEHGFCQSSFARHQHTANSTELNSFLPS